MAETCDVEYAGADGHRIARPKCTRPKGHRDDSINCYSDPDGCHCNGSMWWTNKHTQSMVSEDDHA